MRTTITAALVAAAILTTAAPAIAGPKPAWITEADAANGAITVEAIERREQWLDDLVDRTELRQLNGPYLTAAGDPDRTPGVQVRTYSDAVEQWRPLVETFFMPEDVPWAMRVLNCESTGDPNAKNPRSSASGLFQHLARLWPQRAADAGWAGADVFDPVANVAVAAWLFYTDGPGHWVCR